MNDLVEPARQTAEDAAHRSFCTELSVKLRTPLNAIIGYAELLSLGKTDNRQGEDVQQILRSAKELLSIVEKELGETVTPQRMENVLPIGPRMCDLLYVEDDRVNFGLVERILEFRPKVKLLHAPQGRVGLELAEAYHPKLILLDLNLPDIQGSEVLQLLQQNPATANIPVVILSANATPSQIERLLTAGAKNYITKPFDIDPFLAVVDEFTAG